MVPYRTTFSLDQATVSGIRELALIWETSQAGVIRRAVAQAKTQSAPMGVQEALASYRVGAVPRTLAELAELTTMMRADRRADAQARERDSGKQG